MDQLQPRDIARPALLAGSLLLAVACGSGGGGSQPAPPIPPHPPTPVATLAIEKMEPGQATAGAAVTLTGPGLGEASFVWFAGPASARFERLDDVRLKVTVPEYARTGRIEVRAGLGSTESKADFKVVPKPPAVDRLYPSTGRPGSEATLWGSHLAGATEVTFAGIPAELGKGIDAYLEVKVPARARSGEVTVRTPGGVARFPDYPIRPADASTPEVVNLQPGSGPVGTRVRISGNDLLGLDTVEFAGTRAAAEEVTSGSVTAKVPPGAHSGPVALLRKNGESYSTGRTFTVTEGAAAAPAITSFEPESGPPGQRVFLKGPGVGTLHKATLGGLTCLSVPWDADRVAIFIPSAFQKPRSGPLALALPDGLELRTRRPFHVINGKPVIQGLEPESGPAGTPIRVKGRNLAPVQSVTIGGTPAPRVLFPSDQEFLVELPAGCPGGKVRVVTAGGEATSDQAFTRVEGASALTVTIDKLQVTQGMQNPDGTLPLVRGRAGYLRAFVRANAPNLAAPAVRITIRNAAGAEVLDQLIPAPNPAGVPMHILDEPMEATWNLGLPARAFEPGHTLMAQLVWDGTPPALGPAPATFPHDGRPLALDVRTVPPFHLVLRPIRANGVTGQVTAPGRTLEDWTAQLRAIYPLAQVDVAEGPGFDTPIALGSDAGDYDRVAQALEVARKLAPGSQWHYWYGVFAQPPHGTLNGIAADFGQSGHSEGRTAIGFNGDRRETGGSHYADTMAHELGHCMGRYHSPCGGAAGPDVHYPHPEAGLGGPGLHVPEGRLISPEAYKDIMGYCYPRWSSDYTYKAILDFRAKDPMPQAEPQAWATPAPRENSLLVWGRVQDGRLELEPAFQAPLEPRRPEPGDYRLVLRDGQGRVLDEVPFATREVPDLPGNIRNFMLTLPCPPSLSGSLAAIEVVHDCRVLGSLRSPDTAKAAAERREPVAVPWGPGNVRLGWDHGTWPSVIVRDPGTGEVLSVATGGAVELATRLHDLELLMSDGLRTTIRMVRVH